jgi:hypothetical protein
MARTFPRVLNLHASVAGSGRRFDTLWLRSPIFDNVFKQLSGKSPYDLPLLEYVNDDPIYLQHLLPS